jgi:thioesterase domain-containing protein
VSVAALLAELRSRDIGVWTDGDQLRCSAPAGGLTPELRDQLRQRKRDIVEFLRSADARARQARAIVPLQPRGDRVPVFGVAGHNGDVFCYRALAQHLGEDQPFFGLQPPGLDGHSAPLERVEDLAAYFAAQVLAFRPQGPYVIAGYCAGGAIAYELARQLVAQGRTISFVALFASPYPQWFQVLPAVRRHLAQRMDRVRHHAQALAALSYGDRWGYITEQLRQRTARRETNELAAPDPVLVRRAKVEHATRVAVQRYTPARFDGRLSVFLPSKEWLRPSFGLGRWRRVARDTTEYVGPDGGSADLMLLEPQVRGTAERFRHCRDRRGTEGTP